jgi:hypothetical protein
MNIEELQKKVYTQIDIFQDIWSWQPGESRNALVCDIRDKVDKIFEKAKKEQS